MSSDMTHASAQSKGTPTDSWWEAAGKKPNIGLLAFVLVLLWSPVAHSVSVIFHTYAEGMTSHVLGFLMGLVGFALIWRGFRHNETEATLFGWMGGNIIWIGWFEETFETMSHVMRIPPLQHMGNDFFTGNLLLMQSMLFPLLAFLILLGANKDTRCRMFLWFHRNFRLRPEKPTVAYRRQYSRITALENIMISWVFYIIIICFFDPRIFGPTHWATYALFGGSLVWGGYLLRKLSNIGTMGLAIRYAIPTVAPLWLTIEMASLWDWLTEIWVKPFDYPISMSLMLAAFIGFFVVILGTQKDGFLLRQSPA